ncbi:MAG: DUF1800 domain-containing protein [Saprospiraceae bacterium]|jgi:hypothetical protein|nr:DUF1800 domain-containing protein [Saprospiraceae bacterium]
MVNCAETNINPYKPRPDKLWDKRKAIHLFRRTSFGVDLTTIKASLNLDPVSVVNKIVDDARTLPPTAPPSWSNWTLSNYSSNQDIRITQIGSQYMEWNTQWIKDMINNGLRDRMSWFWSNHFVTKLETYFCPSWMYRYHALLQKHALGNFKTFVYEMGLTPAMLIFLNNIQNTRFQPNENYARELLELFTLGVDNGYNQSDIVNVARAISGWNGIDQTNLCGEVAFIQPYWDSGQKTIFSKTGAWGYADVINLLFDERPVQISEYISRKLYSNFVNPEVSEDMIKLLGKVFRDNNFELAPLMKAMLSCEHFFDDASVGTIIPGHIEYLLTFVNEIGYSEQLELYTAIGYSAAEYNQQMFSPTDVAGWPGNRLWVNSGSFQYRAESILNIMSYYYAKNGNKLEELRTLAKELINPGENSPTIICNAIIDHFLPNGLQKTVDYEDALVVFKAEIPENYFQSGQWNLDWEYAPAQVLYLINYLANLPEFQLK